MFLNMIRLEPRNVHWLGDKDHAPWDKCAHGQVFMEIDGVVLVEEGEDDWNLSAGALHLLRTLEKSHSFESPLFENLIPCCGHGMYKIDEETGLVIIGCPNGINFQVIHTDDGVNIVKDGHPRTINMESWRWAVVRFSEAVKSFYDSSDPKVMDDEIESEGFNQFMKEWDQRHSSSVRDLKSN